MCFCRSKVTIMNIESKKGLCLVFISLFFISFVASAQINDTIVPLTPTNRNVLLEEYTGIYCGYCPDGHRMANEIAAANPGRVNIINIHVGSLASNTYTTEFGTAFVRITKKCSPALRFRFRLSTFRILLDNFSR